MSCAFVLQINAIAAACDALVNVPHVTLTFMISTPDWFHPPILLSVGVLMEFILYFFGFFLQDSIWIFCLHSSRAALIS